VITLSVKARANPFRAVTAEASRCVARFDKDAASSRVVRFTKSFRLQPPGEICLGA